MRPFVVLRYRIENAWSRPASAAGHEALRLENSGSVDAYDVSVSPLMLDAGRRCVFAAVPAVHRHETVPIDVCVAPPPGSLVAAISRHVVEDVLAGRPPASHWPVEISYRDEKGRSYSTPCEIRVVRMPLTIEARVDPSAEKAAPPTAEGVQTLAARAEARR